MNYTVTDELKRHTTDLLTELLNIIRYETDFSKMTMDSRITGLLRQFNESTPTEAKGKGYSLEDMENAFTRGYSLGYDGGEQNEGYYHKECWQTFLSSLPPASIEQEKWVEIDFNKRLKARIKVTGNTVEVDDAIDGWGDNIDKQRIIITNLPTPPIEQR